MIQTLEINLGTRRYPIRIGQGILAGLSSCLDSRAVWVLITDETVDEFYGKELVAKWKGSTIHPIILPPGEGTKTFHQVETIVSRMLDLNVTRDSGIIALGGGVVGDVAGFCASIYLRGIAYVQVPTTLLAQVDSSVGGKTGVNLPQGKNTVGSFYQPEAVVIDTETLSTLPRRHLISGLAEVIKYGVILDYDFLTYLQRNIGEILSLQPGVIEDVITRCCALKAEIVIADEREGGLRKVLNYGHTIAHALEAVTAYDTYTHGEAVLIGMQFEAQMARELGLIKPDYLNEIQSLIQASGFDPRLDLTADLLEGLLGKMTQDKKNRGDTISFILPAGEGRTEEALLTKKEARGLLQRL